MPLTIPQAAWPAAKNLRPRPPSGTFTPDRAVAKNSEDLGPWTLDLGLWTLDFGLWTLDFGLWTLDLGLWTLDFGPWTLDFGHWTLDLGLWTKFVMLSANAKRRSWRCLASVAR